ncbi:MAG: helix-turn-helix domain-containing protein [Anaerovoracaceae bacterium]|nr:helix-turn-helix domain-containing protein [Anaerovoracaceae bacterium]
MSGTFSNDLINNTIYHLLNFEKHSSFQAAAREAAVNNNFQIVLLTEDFNQVFTVETLHRTSIEEAVRLRIEGGIGPDQGNVSIMVDGVRTYWGTVRINGEKYYMFLVDNDDSYTSSEIKKLAEIIELAMGMWNYSPVRDVTAEFIRAMRRGNKSLAYILREEGNFTEEIDSVFIITGVGKEEGFKTISSLEKEIGCRILKIAEDDEICGVVMGRVSTKGEEEGWLLEARGRLESLEPDMVFYANQVRNVEGAADAFQMINEVWPFIHSIFPRQKIFTKYELALVGNCVNIAMKGGTVKKNYMNLLDPFLNMNEGKGRQLLETLAIFMLDAGMNTSKTASLMDLHTNTIQYRLKRIREILGVDIMKATVIPGLVMALAMERIEKITRAF